MVLTDFRIIHVFYHVKSKTNHIVFTNFNHTASNANIS